MVSLSSACLCDTAFPPQGLVPQAVPRHASPGLDGTWQREEQSLRCPCPSGALRSCPSLTPVSPPALPAPGPSLRLLPLHTLFPPVSTRLTLLSPPISSHPLRQLLFWPLLAQTPSSLVESPPSNTPTLCFLTLHVESPHKAGVFLYSAH